MGLTGKSGFALCVVLFLCNRPSVSGMEYILTMPKGSHKNMNDTVKIGSALTIVCVQDTNETEGVTLYNSEISHPLITVRNVENYCSVLGKKSQRFEALDCTNNEYRIEISEIHENDTGSWYCYSGHDKSQMLQISVDSELVTTNAETTPTQTSMFDFPFTEQLQSTPETESTTETQTSNQNSRNVFKYTMLRKSMSTTEYESRTKGEFSADSSKDNLIKIQGGVIGFLSSTVVFVTIVAVVLYTRRCSHGSEENAHGIQRGTRHTHVQSPSQEGGYGNLYTVPQPLVPGYNVIQDSNKEQVHLSGNCTSHYIVAIHEECNHNFESELEENEHVYTVVDTEYCGKNTSAL